MTAREQLSYWVKAAVSRMLYSFGVLQLLQSIVMRRRAVVLMYHRVLSPDEQRRTGSHPALVVHRQTFANQMGVLKRRFTVLSLDEFSDHIAKRIPFYRSSCLITFDDGWLDNFTHALPILREHGLPAVIFLPVNYIGRRRLFAREALTHLVVKAVLEARKDTSRALRFRQLLEDVGLTEVLNIPDGNPRPAIVSIISGHQYVSSTSVERVVSSLAAELDVRAEDLTDADTFVDWDQVEAMASHNIAFGGHGAEHRVLTQVPGDVVQDEIHVSKEMMNARFHDTVPTFSYPGGGWNPEIAATVKGAGYRLAFTTEAGHVSCDDDPFTLRRLNIHQGVTDSTPMFLARLVGLF